MAFDETSTIADVDLLFTVFNGGKSVSEEGFLNFVSLCCVVSLPGFFHLLVHVLMCTFSVEPCSHEMIEYLLQVDFTAESLASEASSPIPESVLRTTPYMTHPIFNS